MFSFMLVLWNKQIVVIISTICILPRLMVISHSFYMIFWIRFAERTCPCRALWWAWTWRPSSPSQAALPFRTTSPQTNARQGLGPTHNPVHCRKVWDWKIFLFILCLPSYLFKQLNVSFLTDFEVILQYGHDPFANTFLGYLVVNQAGILWMHFGWILNWSRLQPVSLQCWSRIRHFHSWSLASSDFR